MFKIKVKMQFDILPRDIIVLICKYLDGKNICKCISQLNKRLNGISSDYKIWRHFCIQLCPLSSNLGLYVQDNSEQWKQFYMNFLPNNINQGLNYVQLNMILKQLNLPINDKNFLRFYIYVYYGDPHPSNKQILNINLKNCETNVINCTISIYFHLDENQKVLFFYGEKSLYSTIEFVAIDRRFNDPIKTIYSTKCNQVPLSETKKYGYQFCSVDGKFKTGVRVTDLSTKSKSMLLNYFGDEFKDNLNAKRIRLSDNTHETSRMYGNDSSYTDWRQQSCVSIPNIKCGEITYLELTCPIDFIFNKLYKSTNI